MLVVLGRSWAIMSRTEVRKPFSIAASSSSCYPPDCARSSLESLFAPISALICHVPLTLLRLKPLFFILSSLLFTVPSLASLSCPRTRLHDASPFSNGRCLARLSNVSLAGHSISHSLQSDRLVGLSVSLPYKTLCTSQSTVGPLLQTLRYLLFILPAAVSPIAPLHFLQVPCCLAFKFSTIYFSKFPLPLLW